MDKKRKKTLHHKKGKENPEPQNLDKKNVTNTETAQTEIPVENEELSVAKPDEITTEEKITILNDRYLRLLAEYDNFRKRTIKEKSEIIKTASENLIRELLPILDNLDRATEHKNDKTTLDEYVNGIALIEGQLRTILSIAGLEPMKVIGEPFDPTIHDAVMQIEMDEYKTGIVVNDTEKGYKLSGKVIRHPKVIVSK